MHLNWEIYTKKNKKQKTDIQKEKKKPDIQKKKKKTKIYKKKKKKKDIQTCQVNKNLWQRVSFETVTDTKPRHSSKTTARQ